jgi:hypothetical protein
MEAMSRKAPTLAWLLTALACFVIGTLVGTGWGQADALPVFPTVGVVVTVEVGFAPTETPSPTPRPTSTSTPDPALPTPTLRPCCRGQ